MIKTSPIKSVEDIERIKQKYREKELYLDLLMFLLVINTGLKMTTLFEMKVSQVKNKKYIQVAKGITYLLSDEMIDLISIVTKDKEPTDLAFSRKNKGKTSRYYFYVNFKDVAAELGLYSISVESWRRTFGYHHYMKYKDLLFLQWYFNQNTVEQTMDFIEINEPISSRFQQGLNF